MNPGYLFALITILIFGSWAVPTKTLGQNPLVKTFWLTLGHLIVALAIFIFLLKDLQFQGLIYPFLAGILWAIGMSCGYISIKHLGITRALGIFVPLQIVISALWGLIFFREAAALNSEKLILTIFSVSLLSLAALFMVLSGKEKQVSIGNLKIGVIAAIVLAFFHGSFFVPLKASVLPYHVTFLALSLGMVLTAIIIIAYNKLKIADSLVNIGKMTLSGLMLGVGNFTALLTIQYLGVSHGYPLTQLGIVINTLWGVFLFKEVKSLRSRLLIAIGVLAAIIGAVILNSARA
ncbi:MAG: GRP family sugar transporter [Candidatus Daviesbacteria bacterium]